jgi:hypothetical protein
MIYIIAAKALLDATVCVWALLSTGHNETAILFAGFCIADLCSIPVAR